MTPINGKRERLNSVVLVDVSGSSKYFPEAGDASNPDLQAED